MAKGKTFNRGESVNKLIIDALRGLARRHSMYHVYTDFLTLAACALSNAVDKQRFAEREEMYMTTIRKYERDEGAAFPRVLGALVNGFEPVPGSVEFRDVLGSVFMELELGNEWAGQFFTPYCVALMMAQMNLGDQASIMEAMKPRGFIRACEPAVGGGAMIIALAEAMWLSDINYQQHLHVTAIDVDLRAVHMAYIQLSLLHVPAVIVHGNALSLEEWSCWYTPAHVLGGWGAKLRRDETQSYIHEVHAHITPAPTDDDGADADLPEGSQLVLF